LGLKKYPRVGLVWSGNAAHKNDKNRSIPLKIFLDYLPEGFEYISLQKEVREADMPFLQDKKITFLGEKLENFTDTAALCNLMDLIISVDTSVVHLSGALNKKTWLLLPYCPDWRWLLDRNDTPWYRSMRLFRQNSEMNWNSVLKEIKSLLESFKNEFDSSNNSIL
jgi:hypothetical protein